MWTYLALKSDAAHTETVKLTGALFAGRYPITLKATDASRKVTTFTLALEVPGEEWQTIELDPAEASMRVYQLPDGNGERLHGRVAAQAHLAGIRRPDPQLGARRRQR